MTKRLTKRVETVERILAIAHVRFTFSAAWSDYLLAVVPEAVERNGRRRLSVRPGRRGQEFRELLARAYYERYGERATTAALNDCVRVLAGQARRKGAGLTRTNASPSRA